MVDDLEPRDVVYRDGELFERGVPASLAARDDSFLKDAAVREAVRPFWVFTDAGIANAREIAGRLPAPGSRSDADGLTEWAGCEAVFAGAGAGIGAVAGTAAGPEGTSEAPR